MIKHDYKQQVNKEQPPETIIETILAGVALLGLVSTCIYIIGSMQ